MVHLAGIITFWVVGFAGRVGWKWVVLATVNIGMMGVVDRSGLVAFGAAMFLCLALCPRSGVPWRILSLVSVLVAGLWLSGFRHEMPGTKGREISFNQFVTIVGSITGDAGNDGLDSTKEWRLDWWSEIRDYTFRGPYFWTGKGFGINLADDDGFQVLADKSLRSPHSIHMMVLARAGVPGLALWVLTQLAWGVGVAVAFRRSRREGRDQWARLFLFLGAYWLAFLINGSLRRLHRRPDGRHLVLDRLRRRPGGAGALPDEAGVVGRVL